MSDTNANNTTPAGKPLPSSVPPGYLGAKWDRRIAVKATDIFSNDGLKVIRITL